MKNYKDAFNDAYYDAIDNGLSEQEAEKLADNAVTNFTEMKIEQADMLNTMLKENMQ